MSPQMDVRKIVTAILAVGMSAIASQAADSGGATFTQVQKQVVAGNKVAAVGTKVSAGTPLATQANSRAEIKLPNGGVARIGQGSNFVFDSHKMTLRQGSGLFKLNKGTVVTPSLNCTSGSGVLSVHASKGYEACFVLDGRGSVNGQPLIAGEALVREKGATRKIVFDVQRLLKTSSLVSKFPQTPWVKEALAVGALQHDLTASHAASVVANNRSKQIVTATPGNNTASTDVAPLLAQRLKPTLTGKLPGNSVVVALGNGAQGSVSSAGLTLSGINTGRLTNSIGGGTLTVGGGSTGATTATFSGSGGSSGTLIINQGFTGGATLQIGPTSGGTVQINPASLGTLQVSPVLTVNPNPTINSAPTVSAGTLTLSGAHPVSGNCGTKALVLTGANAHPITISGSLRVSSGNLITAPGQNPSH